MDGLEAMEINLSECKNVIDFRIDASTYKKEYVRTDKILKAMNPPIIEDKLISIQNFGAYSLCNYINFTETGTPFLMTQNVRHNYIDWNNIRYIDNRSHMMLHKSHCKKNQVLVTMAGEYLGRVAVYDKDFICSSNQAIAKLTLKNGVSPYYVATFLNSVYGQNQIQRFKTITGQPNINMALIKSLMIPILSDDIIKIITDIVSEANQMFETGQELVSNAEKILDEDLQTSSYVEPKEINTVRNLSSFNEFFRFDAEYYQTAYDDYYNLLTSYSEGYGFVGDICKVKDKNYKPDVNKEYSYIELANVGAQGNITDCDVLYGSELPTRARRIVATNDVIISSVEGSLSKCAFITEDYNGFVCTNGFYVISCEKINPETLMLLFKNKAIVGLMKKGCSGTILSAIGKDEFVKIPLPLIKSDIQETIKSKVDESNCLRKQGEKLLMIADKIIEIAIEQGEKEAIKYYESMK